MKYSQFYIIILILLSEADESRCYIFKLCLWHCVVLFILDIFTNHNAIKFNASIR